VGWEGKEKRKWAGEEKGRGKGWKDKPPMRNSAYALAQRITIGDPPTVVKVEMQRCGNL